MNEDASKPLICLDQFLKATCLVESGGMAKHVIQGGEVVVNGTVETRRRKKLVADDVITYDGETFRVGDAFVDETETDETETDEEKSDEIGSDETPRPAH